MMYLYICIGRMLCGIRIGVVGQGGEAIDETCSHISLMIARLIQRTNVCVTGWDN
jgi:hypothetical protein